MQISHSAASEYSDGPGSEDGFRVFWKLVGSFLALWGSSVDVCGDIGIGIANGGGKISDMLSPSERA